MRASYACLVSAACLALAAPGCSHTLEHRVIAAFAKSLDEGDVDTLRKYSSSTFEEKALPDEKAIHSLQTIDLPAGKFKVTKVEEIDESHRKVTIELEKPKRKIVYDLTLDDESKGWVVDDLALKSREAKDRSIAEQVSLLIATRDFIDSWQSSSRDRILDSTTSDFREALSRVPPQYLSGLCGRVVKDLTLEKNTPLATIAEDTSDVRLPTDTGEVVVQFERDGHGWRVRRVSVKSRREGETIESVAEMAIVMQAVLEFQGAYAAANKETLKTVCTPRLYDGSLAIADLSTVELPLVSASPDRFEIAIENGVAHCIVKSDTEITKVSLLRQPEENPDLLPNYRIDEVALYELNGTQDKRLSVLFLGQALLQVYAEGLTERNLETLRASSTTDFNSRVWNKLDPRRLKQLPIPGLGVGRTKILNTQFQGGTTQITVEQAGNPVTYVLNDQGGRVLMDDILTPALDRPQSLKTTLDVMIPVVDFTHAIDPSATSASIQLTGHTLESRLTTDSDPARGSPIDTLRGNSSREFCRIVWNQVERIPQLPRNPGEFLMQPLNRLELASDRALVVLGDDNKGARIQLQRERGSFVVDDVELIAGPTADQRQSLRRLLRQKLQTGG
jgi:hypothetical protein